MAFQAIQTADYEFGENNPTGDVRDTKMFKDFKKKVLAFIKEKKEVNWRILGEEFYYDYYHLTMAVEQLDGGQIKWEKHRIPERIRVK